MGQLKSGKPEAREWSAVALGLIGPDAASAAPLLDQVLNDEQAPDLVRSAAAASLVRIRPAMPDIGSLLAKWMGSYVDRIVDRVQETFRRMGPAAKSAVPKIAEMATNPKGGFPRYRTMNILSMIGRDGNPEVLAALTKILMEDPSDEFAGSAAHSMMELKSAAVPALIQALGLKSPRRRSWAARTLGRNGKDASAGCDALKRLLQDPEGEVRREAAVALWRITAKPEGLIEILSDTSQRGLGNVAEALDILAEIGPPAQSAVPQLLEALKGEHAADAASALGKIGKKDDGVLSALMVAGGREDEQIRASVAQAFGNLGVTTPEVLAWLRASTRADTVTVRVEAWASLAVLSKDADALPMLIVEIDETGRGDNVAVAAALVRIGPDARVTVPALERALKNTRGYQHGELEKHLRTITGK
jgi:HEAT repeat protein